MADTNWELELNEYIRQGEPDKVDKSNAWKTAIGLQDVDGLKPSEYLIETAKEHIEGKITISEADKRIQSYYEERENRDEIEAETKEAEAKEEKTDGDYKYLIGVLPYSLTEETAIQYIDGIKEVIKEHPILKVKAGAGAYKNLTDTEYDLITNKDDNENSILAYTCLDNKYDKINYFLNTILQLENTLIDNLISPELIFYDIKTVEKTKGVIATNGG